MSFEPCRRVNDSPLLNGNNIISFILLNPSDGRTLKNFPNAGSEMWLWFLLIKPDEDGLANSLKGVIYCRDFMNCSVEDILKKLKTK